MSIPVEVSEIDVATRERLLARIAPLLDPADYAPLEKRAN